METNTPKTIFMISEEQKKEWCLEFFQHVKDLITTGCQPYQFYSEDLLANIACNIVEKNKKLSEFGCPSFAFDLNFDPEKQIVHFYTRGIVYEGTEEEIPLEKWVSENTLIEIHELLSK